MRVLVVGSSRKYEPGKPASPDEDEIADAAQLRLAAREIGSALARHDHVVVVGSDHLKDVDPYVVEGAIAALKLPDVGAAAVAQPGDPATRRIEVHIPHGFPEPYRNALLGDKVHILPHQFPDWDVTVAEVVREVDGVIALGGRLGVLQAGIMAWTLDRPVIAVGSFDGGAKVVWGYSSGRRASFYRDAISDAEIDRLARPWGKGGSGPDADFVVDALVRVSKAAVLAGISRRLLASMIGLALFALGGWLLSITYPFLAGETTVGVHRLFLCVSSAGVLGTMLYTLRLARAGKAIKGRTLIIDLVLGLIAGAISAALYLIAQLALSGKVEVSLASTDFARVALIVSTISLFAAGYLDKAFARCDAASDKIIRGELGHDEHK